MAWHGITPSPRYFYVHIHGIPSFFYLMYVCVLCLRVFVCSCKPLGAELEVCISIFRCGRLNSVQRFSQCGAVWCDIVSYVVRCNVIAVERRGASRPSCCSTDINSELQRGSVSPHDSLSPSCSYCARLN